MSATIINKMLVRAVYENDVIRVSELLTMGADPNYSFKKDGISSNLLKVCLQFRFLECFRILLENGATISASMKIDLLGVSGKEKELNSLIQKMELSNETLYNKKDQKQYA